MLSMGYTIIINVGNSNTLFALFAGDSLVSKWRLETRVNRSADEYGLWLLQILQKENISAEHISGVCIATVVSAAETNIISMVRRFFELDPMLVVPGIKTGLKINYGRVGDLGPDRLANMVALNTYYKKGGIVVDFGTTTSLDVVDDNGVHKGGAVAAGVNLSLHSLAQAAPNLPDVGWSKPDFVIGHNIAHSMQAGCYWGAIDMTVGLIRRIWQELGYECPCIATGGFAREMIEGTDIFKDVDTNLTLKGLKILYDKNS